MQKKSLPVLYPPITSWTWHANVLSILSNYERTLPWVYSNYIQLWTRLNRHEEIFTDFNFCNFPPEDCPWIYLQTLKRETISKMTSDIIEFIKRAIDLDNYIYGVVDESQLIHRDKSEKKYPHELFVFGYNDQDETFDVADFTFKGKYSFEKVTYSDFRRAYYNIERNEDYLLRGKGGIQLLSFYSDAFYCFDTILVKESLEDYLYARNSQYKYRSLHNPDEYVFGIDIYDTLIIYLNSFFSRNETIDLKPFHVMFDHKVLMVNRLKFMQVEAFLCSELSILDNYIKIKEASLIVRNGIIKYNITKEKEILKRILLQIETIKKQEEQEIKNILENIIIKKLPSEEIVEKQMKVIRY